MRAVHDSRFTIPHSRFSGGFTLLEILLALALLAFLMLGVWGALTGAARVRQATDAVMAQSENVRTVQQFLRRYVAAAGMQPWVTDAGASSARMFDGNATSMQYVAPLPLQSGHAGLYLQTLSLEQGKRGIALWLAYQPYTGDAPADGEPVRHLLLQPLRGGKFQYLAAAAFGKPAAWRDDWTAVSGLPLAVRIHVDPAWPVRVPFPDMVIPLHSGEGFGAQIGSVP